MTLDEKKSEILSNLRAELLNYGVQLEDGDIRSSTAGNIWSIWIERKDGSNTSSDPFLVNLNDLAEGVHYVIAIGYRARRWLKWLKEKKAEGPAARGAAHRLPPILIAEDDPEDRMFIQRALKANNVKNPLASVSDGEQLLDYLHHRGKFSGSNESPRPCFILLDLNMPRIDGREALKSIKSDPDLRRIPVVIFTTSIADEDIEYGYENGVNSYVTKPVNADGFVKSIEKLQDYWLNLVQLPPRPNAWS